MDDAGAPVARAKVVVAQELAPGAPAAAAGMILGTTAAVAGAIYILLGRVQEVVGLEAGIAVGFAMIIPAGAIAFTVFARHPEVAHEYEVVSAPS